VVLGSAVISLQHDLRWLTVWMLLYSSFFFHKFELLSMQQDSTLEASVIKYLTK